MMGHGHTSTSSKVLEGGALCGSTFVLDTDPQPSLHKDSIFALIVS